MTITRGDVVANRGTTIIDSGNDIAVDNIGGSICPLTFGKINLAANQTNVDIEVCGQASFPTYIVMPRAGSVIGISAVLSTAITAETAVFSVTKNGTELALSCGLDTVTNTTSDYETAAKDTYTFDAGDKIGVSVVTGSSMTPTTAELIVTVFTEM